MRTGTSNIQLKSLIQELRTKAFSGNINLWKRVASDLSKPTRQRRIVNLSRINRHTKEGETIIVPGKVLANGNLDHSITIAAWSFSDEARLKINQANSKAVPLADFIKEDPKGKKIRIIG